MAQHRSALDSWSSIADEPSARHTFAGLIPLVLAGAGAIGVAPFAVIRWLSGEFAVAVMDTIIVVGFVSLGIYIYRTRKVRFASVLIAIMSVGGVLFSVHSLGAEQIFWAYPAVLASFYLTRPLEAVALTLTMTGVLFLQLYGSVEAAHAASFIITILVTMAFAFGFSVINDRQQNKLVTLATRDPLTGAGNRRAFVEKLEGVIARFERSRVPSSLVLIDIDHFKAVNDNHGHAVGDDVLRRVSHLIDARIRRVDSQYRIGGEEFVVVFDGQGIEAASKLAEELRELVEANELIAGISVTLSIGVAEIRRDESEDGWIHRADEAMYEAKRSGRNRVTVAD